MRKIVFEHKGQAINYYNKCTVHTNKNVSIITFHQEYDHYVVTIYYK